MPDIFIALGSNIDPERHMSDAAALLRKHWPAIRFSSVYRTAPQGVTQQATFLNAVATVNTDESPEEILVTLRSVEHTLKKDPPFRFGPRTIDLDLLLYGNAVMRSKELTLPHPRMHERRFVLEPLTELIDESAVHPTLLEPWTTLLRSTLVQDCLRIPFAL